MYRKKLIRIGAENPQLRQHIRPILNALEKKATHKPIITQEDLRLIRAQEEAYKNSFSQPGKAGHRIMSAVTSAIAKRHRKSERDVDVWLTDDSFADMTIALPHAFNFEIQKLKTEYRPLRSSILLWIDTDQTYVPSFRNLKKEVAFIMEDSVKREFRLPPHLMPKPKVEYVERAFKAHGGGKYTIMVSISLEWLSLYKR